MGEVVLTVGTAASELALSTDGRKGNGDCRPGTHHHASLRKPQVSTPSAPRVPTALPEAASHGLL